MLLVWPSTCRILLQFYLFNYFFFASSLFVGVQVSSVCVSIVVLYPSSKRDHQNITDYPLFMCIITFMSVLFSDRKSYIFLKRYSSFRNYTANYISHHAIFTFIIIEMLAWNVCQLLLLLRIVHDCEAQVEKKRKEKTFQGQAPLRYRA